MLRAVGGQPSWRNNRLIGTWYKLLACDLRDTAALADRLAAAGLDPARPTVIVFECVLAYLDANASTSLLSWTATFCDALVIEYDVMAPNDAFGKIMTANFRRRGWPLLSAAKFQSLTDHERRLAELSFESIEMADMDNVCARLVLADPQEFARVTKLEIFDDPDEFKLMMQHYCLVAAANGDHGCSVVVSFRALMASKPAMLRPVLESEHGKADSGLDADDLVGSFEPEQHLRHFRSASSLRPLQATLAKAGQP